MSAGIGPDGVLAHAEVEALLPFKNTRPALEAEITRLRARVAELEALIDGDPRNRPFARIPAGASQDPGEIVGALEAAMLPESTHE